MDAGRGHRQDVRRDVPCAEERPDARPAPHPGGRREGKIRGGGHPHAEGRFDLPRRAHRPADRPRRTPRGLHGHDAPVDPARAGACREALGPGASSAVPRSLPDSWFRGSPRSAASGIRDQSRPPGPVVARPRVHPSRDEHGERRLGLSERERSAGSPPQPVRGGRTRPVPRRAEFENPPRRGRDVSPPRIPHRPVPRVHRRPPSPMAWPRRRRGGLLLCGAAPPLGPPGHRRDRRRDCLRPGHGPGSVLRPRPRLRSARGHSLHLPRSPRGILWINEIPDIPADAAVGKRTLVVRLGVARATTAFGAIVLAAYSILVVGVVLFSLTPWALLALLAIPLAIKPILGLRRAGADPHALIPSNAGMILATVVTGILLLAGLAIEVFV